MSGGTNTQCKVDFKSNMLTTGKEGAYRLIKDTNSKKTWLNNYKHLYI